MVCPFTRPSVLMLLLSLLRFNLADVNQILPGARGFLLSSSQVLENCQQHGAAMLHPSNGEALGTQVLPALRDLSKGEAATSGWDRICHRVGCGEVARGDRTQMCGNVVFLVLLLMEQIVLIIFQRCFHFLSKPSCYNL